MADELAPRRVAPRRAALDPLPKGLQAGEAFGHWVAGDDGGIDAADRSADHPIRLDAGFMQRRVDATLIGAERAAALKHQHHLAGQCGRRLGRGLCRPMKDIIHKSLPARRPNSLANDGSFNLYVRPPKNNVLTLRARRIIAHR